MTDDNNTDDIERNTYRFQISREAAIDYGMIVPTQDEVDERNRTGSLFHHMQQDKRARALAALRELQAKDGLTAIMLELHAVDFDAEWSPECLGCGTGYEDEKCEWPCRTVRALANYHDIELPDDLPGKSYEKDFVPQTVESYQNRLNWLKPPSAFVTLDDGYA